VRFARETGALTLEHVVHLMTQLPATTFRLADRGVIRKGAFADLVLFGPDELTDHATYEEPARLSTGVQHLIVNGRSVISGGRLTGQLPGRAV
jgi:N-acyl-D-amino-acid deacylase